MNTEICCLIMAHKNPQQLARLAKKLTHPAVRIFIHLDKKMRISDAEKEQVLQSNPRGHIMPKRVSCYLDDWSLTNATIQLIDFAKSEGGGNYYLLMSGQDYPIKPIDQLVTHLNQNYPQPFIDCTPYDDQNWIRYKFANTPIYTRISRCAHGLSSRFVKRIVMAAARHADRFAPQKFTTHDQLQKYHLPLYGGSAWWILPDTIIDQIMIFANSFPELMVCYKNTRTPEETFFQTFAMQTTLAGAITLNPPTQTAQNCLTYASFTTPTKSFCGHPHVLTKEDLNWLRERPEYIARKFDEQIDSDILNALDQTT